MTSERPATTGVFLCDDQGDLRDALADVVGSLPGFRVVGVAEDGAGCLSGLRTRRADVLVLDVSLPGGGAGLAAAIRSEHPSLAIIVFSAHAEPSVEEAMRGAGADDYVVKTGRLAPLRDVLLRHSSLST